MATLPMDVLQLILEHLCTSDIASLGRAVVALGSEPQLWLTPWLAIVREDERTRRIGHWRLIGAANRPELLTLTEVDVSGRKIGPALGLAIERAIHTAPALARLYLCGNALGAEGVGPIVRALATAPLCGVTCIDLSANELGTAGAVEVAHALEANRSVTTLSLAANGMGDAGATAVAEMLATNATLAALDIRQNALSCAGRTALMAALR